MAGEPAVTMSPTKPKAHNAQQIQARAKARKITYDQAHDQRRGTSQERGYDEQWRQYAKAYLHDHPLCVYCRESGIDEPSTCVDHIKPLHLFPHLKMEPTNHAASCVRCNAVKARADAMKYGDGKAHF